MEVWYVVEKFVDWSLKNVSTVDPLSVISDVEVINVDKWVSNEVGSEEDIILVTE